MKDTVLPPRNLWKPFYLNFKNTNGEKIEKLRNPIYRQFLLFNRGKPFFKHFEFKMSKPVGIDGFSAKNCRRFLNGKRTVNPGQLVMTDCFGVWIITHLHPTKMEWKGLRDYSANSDGLRPMHTFRDYSANFLLPTAICIGRVVQATGLATDDEWSEDGAACTEDVAMSRLNLVVYATRYVRIGSFVLAAWKHSIVRKVVRNHNLQNLPS